MGKSKEEILAEAREKAVEIREVDAEEKAAAEEEAEAAAAAAQAEAAERAARVREAMVDEANTPVAAPKPETAPSHDPRTQGSTEWGPYDTYEIVQTRYGQFAVEPGYKMFFEEIEFFDSREKRMRLTNRPVYVWVGRGPDDPNFGKTRDELVRGLRPGERAPLKVVTESV